MIKTRRPLYVLYAPREDLDPDDAVLSFMNPDDEYNVAWRHPKFFFGRKEMEGIREDARASYVGLVARIGATRCGGRTLRQALAIDGSGNPWWYHKVSEKQVEVDGTFNFLLQIYTICRVASRGKYEDIALFNAPAEVCDVIGPAYKTEAKDTVRDRRPVLLRGLFSRLKFLAQVIRYHVALGRTGKLPEGRPDIVFQGFWDWSVTADDRGAVRDNYFKALPDRLKSNGMTSSWFLMLDPSYKPGSQGRQLKNVLSSSKNNQRLIFVEKFLGICDILSAALNFRSAVTYIRHSRSKEFRSIFRTRGLDLWPLLRKPLAYYFFNAGIPKYLLAESAYRKAFRYYRPKGAFTFLEFFLLSRSFYEGARLGSPETVKFNMQHASYGREKTFILMDAEREYRGSPDACPAPAPDYFFVMGELCRDIQIENGVSLEKILLTGSARYDNLDGIRGHERPLKAGEPVKVLLVPTLNLAMEFEIVQAASLAADGIPVKLKLRSHPFARMENLPGYKKYSDNIISSTSTLEDDLKDADIVVSTYSTVAEEAFLRGIPVIQWLTKGFNGSVFRDLNIVRKVSSADELGRALKSFIADPKPFYPTKDAQEAVLRNCFYKADGQASSRIADATAKILSSRAK